MKSWLTELRPAVAFTRNDATVCPRTSMTAISYSPAFDASNAMVLRLNAMTFVACAAVVIGLANVVCSGEDCGVNGT